MLKLLTWFFRPVQRVSGSGVYWILSLTAAVFVLMGWFLPWFPHFGG
ncbi:MAG: hypothetical protein JOZ92_04040, partial [Candidatus Dormibacteraeota bacterium]|nr:hypothetical protein [Candidatus Dormibacteraeota bacterium]